MKQPALRHLVTPELWFVCGSQHLYGPETLAQVTEQARQVAGALDVSPASPLDIVFKGIMTTPEDIRRLCLEASADPRCAGLTLWMHTFSPSKMWILGLTSLQKPFVHLHTQFDRELPWDSIDMEYMNLNQAAHGDREAGFMHTRLRLERKVVVGHWSDAGVQQRLGVWARAAWAWHDWQAAKIARFGDNMRDVGVTEGDKVSAEMHFGFSVNTHPVSDLAAWIDAVSNDEVDALISVYQDEYEVAPELLPGAERHASLRDGAQIEAGLRAFLEEGGFKGFTDTFEDLHGLAQLPGLAATVVAMNKAVRPSALPPQVVRPLRIRSAVTVDRRDTDQPGDLPPGQQAEFRQGRQQGQCHHRTDTRCGALQLKAVPGHEIGVHSVQQLLIEVVAQPSQVRHELLDVCPHALVLCAAEPVTFGGEQ